jgi:hypothetical protein
VGVEVGVGVWRSGVIDRRRGLTYAPGHMLVRMNRGVLCNADSGSNGPKVLVKCNATFSDTYNVATKNANVEK